MEKKISSGVILVIRDGWGYRKTKKGNALAEVPTPCTDALMRDYPNTLLSAAGRAVGLPPGYIGNSEVGHITLGSGRIILQPFEEINESIRDRSFFKNDAFLSAISNCKKNGSTLHLISILQKEGVHGHLDHLFALLDLCKKQHFYQVYVHALTDGRDSPVTKSVFHVKALIKKFKLLGLGKIATISGRYYGMDRDKRWDRTKLYYDCVVHGICAEEFEDPLAALSQCHARHETDEFIKPRKLHGYGGIKSNDSVLFVNFRTDRPRQFTRAVVEEDFEGWQRKPLPVYYVAMTQYYQPMRAHVAFGERKISNVLGEVISRNGLMQLRITETEKYAHVTYFFNGQNEKQFEGEDRIMIPSLNVATYDLAPEMRVHDITKKLIESIKEKRYRFIIVNLVNGDMVGHTGVKKAIWAAVKAIDGCLGEITREGLAHGYTLLVTSDHGNVEDQTSKWRTSHTVNPVPFILVTTEQKRYDLQSGKGLRDVAPTILALLGLKKPKEMTGENLLREK